MEPRRRKKNRLKDHDYGCPGYYFLTACIRNKADLLGEIAAEINISRGDSVGRDDPGAPLMGLPQTGSSMADHPRPTAPPVHLSQYGHIVEEYLISIPAAYKNVYIDRYVIMPNHIHLILRIDSWENGAPGSSRPTQLVPRIISALKRFSNQRAGFDMWQTSYYDRVIRTEAEYLRICEYIENNPAKWREDCYYHTMQTGDDTHAG